MYRAQRWGIAVIFAIHGMVQGTFAARIPAISENLGLSAGLLGLALFMPSVGSLSLMPLAGRLIHRVGLRRSTQLMLGAWTVVVVLPALAPNLLTLCLSLALMGACAGLADIAMNAHGSAVEQGMGKSIMSGLHGMWSIGVFLGAGVGALAAAWDVDVRVHFAVVAAVLLVIGQAACRTIPVRMPGAAEAEPEPPRFSLPRGPVLLIALVAFCAVFVEVSGSDWAGVYLRKVSHSGHAEAAVGVAVFAVLMAASRLSGDGLVRRLGPTSAVRAMAAIGTVGAVMIVLAINGAVTIIGFGLMGVGIAIVVPLAFAAAGRIGSARGGGQAGAGSAIAGLATVAYGAGLAAPGAIGGLASVTSLRGSFVMITVLVAVVCLGAAVLRAGAADETVEEPSVYSEVSA
jgi:predicted MFS family arabinose efflux permease